MGFWELCVVLVVGLVVLGPERLPSAIRSIARWLKTIRQLANNVQTEINEELRVHELHQNLKKAEQQGMENISSDLQKSVNELTQAAASVTHSYSKEKSNSPTSSKAKDNDN